MNKVVVAFICVVSAVTPAAAQQPYAGLEQRPIKALSAEQTADLRAGRGMGMALAAELNGYPGPAHVLENADALRLTGDQRRQTKALFEAMKAEAMPLGDQLVEQEARLDHLFANRDVTPSSLHTATREIGETQALLRETHLKYHLAMLEVLTPAQIGQYRTLRGYDTPAVDQQQHKHQH